MRTDLAERARRLAAETRRRLDARERARNQKFTRYFPDCTDACRDPTSRKVEDHGGFCRVLYGKHLGFFKAGAIHRERLMLGANRVGKTDGAAYEVTCHLTGQYPHWWQGRRFDHPTDWWVAGDTMLTTRDILQVALMGPIDGVETRIWTGMIPAHLVHDVSRRSGGVSDCLDQVWVDHVSRAGTRRWGSGATTRAGGASRGRRSTGFGWTRSRRTSRSTARRRGRATTSTRSACSGPWTRTGW